MTDAYSGDDFYCDQALGGAVHIDVVVDTEDVLAFHHTRPCWPIHILVVPKLHVPSLTDLGGAPPDIIAKVMKGGRTIATDVEAEHGACRVLTNLGRYQDSKHLHVHVNSGLPRLPETD